MITKYLETTLNNYAAQGWRLVACATADIPAFFDGKQEFLGIMERDV